jgi:1-acyl-sn-glycerol-3-phosphate acyltransferase
LWELQGNIWHGKMIFIFGKFCFFEFSLIGYEVEGLEHIPTSGPVLIVFYHGALPIDFYYLFAKIWLYRNRRMRVVADRFVFKIPGMIFYFHRKQ